MISKQITVTGYVQGVGFRYYVYKKAHLLGITGFVRNEPDGTVYIEASASNQQDMDTFLDYIRKGPSLARIENVYVSDIPETKFEGFKIM